MTAKRTVDRNATATTRRTSRLLRWAKILVSAGVLGATVWVVDPQAIGAAFRRLDARWLLPLVAILAVRFAVLAIRWWGLAEEVAKIGARQHVVLYLRSLFWAAWTPANLGADSYRVFRLRKEASVSALLGVVLRERVVGWVISFWGFLACWGWLIASGRYRAGAAPLVDSAAWIAAVGGSAGGLLLVVSVVRSRDAWRWLHWKPLQMIVTVSWWRFLGGLGWSLVALGLWILVVRGVAASLGVAVGIPECGIVAILAEIARLLPISAQGIGVREAAFSYGFELLGLSPASGFTVGLVSYALLMLALMLCGLWGWGWEAYSNLDSAQEGST